MTKIINDINGAAINLIILVIRPPFKRLTYKFN